MNDELRSLLDKALLEEGNDNQSYEMMADIAAASGMKHAAGVLRDIACEEKMHKHLVKKILEGCIV